MSPRVPSLWVDPHPWFPNFQTATTVVQVDANGEQLLDEDAGRVAILFQWIPGAGGETCALGTELPDLPPANASVLPYLLSITYRDHGGMVAAPWWGRTSMGGGSMRIITTRVQMKG